jgi:hypothetical protein
MLLTHQKMSSPHQKSAFTAPNLIKKYFCVLAQQNNCFFKPKCILQRNVLNAPSFERTKIHQQVTTISKTHQSVLFW